MRTHEEILKCASPIVRRSSVRNGVYKQLASYFARISLRFAIGMGALGQSIIDVRNARVEILSNAENFGAATVPVRRRATLQRARSRIRSSALRRNLPSPNTRESFSRQRNL